MREIKNMLLRLYDQDEAEEKCGIVLVDGTLIPSPNIHDSPETAFTVDPNLLIKHENELWGTWHTHPKTKANLSQADYLGFLNWEGLRHFIVGVDGVRCFAVEDGLIVEEDID